MVILTAGGTGEVDDVISFDPEWCTSVTGLYGIGTDLIGPPRRGAPTGGSDGDLGEAGTRSPGDISKGGVEGRSCLIFTSHFITDRGITSAGGVGGLSCLICTSHLITDRSFSRSRSRSRSRSLQRIVFRGARATFGWKLLSNLSLSDNRTTLSGFCSTGGS